MKKLIFLIICIFLFASCGEDRVINPPPPPPPPVQQANVIILTFYYENNLLSSDVDYVVKLQNTGLVNANNIRLRFISTLSNPPNSYIDTVFADWGNLLLPSEIEQKIFWRTLPSGYNVTDAWLNVTWQIY